MLGSIVGFEDIVVKWKELTRDIEYNEEEGVYRVVEGDFEWYMPQREVMKVDFCQNFMEKYDRYVERLRPGETLLKVGAATGEDVIPAARQVETQGQVYAVEPEPSNFACLEKNLDLKSVDNVEPIRTVVSDTAGEEVEFMRHNRSHSTHRVLTGPSEYEESDYSTLTLTSTTVDELVEDRDIDQPDMLSVTVNKHEGAVLQGAEETLRNARYVVCVENDNDDATAVLRDAGFRREDSGYVGSLFVNNH